MPSEIEFGYRVDKISGDSKGAMMSMVHRFLHQGNYLGANGWAGEIGLNTPVGENPLVGAPLTAEQQQLLQEILETHQPTENGLPDHDF